MAEAKSKAASRRSSKQRSVQPAPELKVPFLSYSSPAETVDSVQNVLQYIASMECKGYREVTLTPEEQNGLGLILDACVLALKHSESQRREPNHG